MVILRTFNWRCLGLNLGPSSWEACDLQPFTLRADTAWVQVVSVIKVQEYPKSLNKYLASNPISRSRSASSKTRTSRDLTQLAKSNPSDFLLNISSKRPGVATRMFPLWGTQKKSFRLVWARDSPDPKGRSMKKQRILVFSRTGQRKKIKVIKEKELLF